MYLRGVGRMDMRMEGGERAEMAVGSSSLSALTPSLAEWSRVEYRIFDAPSVNGPFAERLRAATAVVSSVATDPCIFVPSSGAKIDRPPPGIAS